MNEKTPGHCEPVHKLVRQSPREKGGGEYADIIDLPHPVSSRHARMSVQDRAAQFAPFAALTGFDAAIDHRARQVLEASEATQNEIVWMDE